MLQRRRYVDGTDKLSDAPNPPQRLTQIAPTETQIFTCIVAVLNTFGLTSSVPGQTVPIIRGQVNRVPEPGQPDFIVLWPLMRDRLATNIDATTDSQVTGSIVDNVLDLAAVLLGSAIVGQPIYGLGVTSGCQIMRQLTGAPGGIGTYQTTPTAPVPMQTLYVGMQQSTQKTEVTIQADVHGPASADNATRISTLWRDEFGVNAFTANSALMAPLYTSDPRQIAFDNAEQQVEERWSIDLCLQANITITTTMQFADHLAVSVRSVQANP